MFAALPLMILPVAAYNLLVELLAGGFYGRAANARLTAPLFGLTNAAGGAWPVSAADLLLAASLIVLFIELIKSAPSRRIAPRQPRPRDAAVRGLPGRAAAGAGLRHLDILPHHSDGADGCPRRLVVTIVGPRRDAAPVKGV